MQPFERAVDPFAGAVFAHRQRLRDLRQGFVFEETQQYGAPVRFPQRAERLVQHWRQFFPQGLGRGGLGFCSHLGLVLVALAPGGGADLRQGGEAGRVKQPAGQGGLAGDAARLFGRGR